MKSTLLISVFIFIALASCKPADDHGHAHAEDGSHPGEEVPTVKATLWSDNYELYVEFPAFIAGKTSKFAAHFTEMDGHKPVIDGSVIVTLRKGAKGAKIRSNEPSSPGIFGPSIQPPEKGIYQLIFDLTTPKGTERFEMPDVEVFETLEAAAQSLGHHDDEEAITFLKEQAWKMDFQTVPVAESESFQTINTSGSWQLASSDYKNVVATTNGQLVFKTDNLTEGTALVKGQRLMVISSSGLTFDNLKTEIEKAKADLDQAEAEYSRHKKLFETDAIAKSDIELSKQKYQVARVQYDALRNGYSGDGKMITAPFNGFIMSMELENGDFVEQGDLLLTVASKQSRILEIQVNPTLSSELEAIKDVRYKTPSGTWSSLIETGGEILSIGKDVDMDNPMLTVYARINEPVNMPAGSFTEVQIQLGTGQKGLVIPETALLEDYGNYSVITQLSGESFERRNITIGTQNGNEVVVLSGLSIGDVVVTKGAYQVKMASMMDQAPAHGHAH